MICIGPGPGPKNVLAQTPEGLVVVPYAIWKHKLSKELFIVADKEYVTAVGFVQFEVKEREANNQTVRDVVIKTPGSSSYVRITVWPEFESTIINRGDFIAVDGVFTRSSWQDDEGAKKESLNISARTIAVVAPAVRDDEPEAAASDSGEEAESLF